MGGTSGMRWMREGFCGSLLVLVEGLPGEEFQGRDYILWDIILLEVGSMVLNLHLGIRIEMMG